MIPFSIRRVEMQDRLKWLDEQCTELRTKYSESVNYSINLVQEKDKIMKQWKKDLQELHTEPDIQDDMLKYIPCQNENIIYNFVIE